MLVNATKFLKKYIKILLKNLKIANYSSTIFHIYLFLVKFKKKVYY